MTIDDIEITFTDGRPVPGDHITYSNVNTETGRETHLSVTYLEELVTSEGFHTGNLPAGVIGGQIPIDKDFYEHVKNYGGIEAPRLRRISRMSFFQPLLVIEWEDGTHSAVDGNHRVVKAYELGIRNLPAFIVKPELWQKAVIEGFPELPGKTPQEKSDLLQKSYSGLY